MSTKEEADAFWDSVGERVKYDSLEVGMLLRIEDYRFGSRRDYHAFCTHLIVDPDGTRHLEFRRAEQYEVDAHPSEPVILVAGEKAE